MLGLQKVGKSSAKTMQAKDLFHGFPTKVQIEGTNTRQRRPELLRKSQFNDNSNIKRFYQGRISCQARVKKTPGTWPGAMNRFSENAMNILLSVGW